MERGETGRVQEKYSCVRERESEGVKIVRSRSA